MTGDDIFINSPTVQTPTELVKSHCQQLPVLVTVTTGFDGVDELHSVAGGEVFRVNSLQMQPRILCRDREGKKLSIPKRYRCHFQSRDENGNESAPYTMTQLLEEWSSHSDLGELRFRVYNDSEVTFTYGAVTKETARLGLLNYEDCYDEVYLVCFPIRSGCISMKPVMIPTYVPMKLTIVTGLKNGCADLFSKFLLTDIPFLERRIKEAKENQDILVFPLDSDQSSGWGEVIPSEYVYAYYKTATLSRGATPPAKFDQYDTESSLLLKIVDLPLTPPLRLKKRAKEMRQSSTLPLPLGSSERKWPQPKIKLIEKMRTLSSKLTSKKYRMTRSNSESNASPKILSMCNSPNSPKLDGEFLAFRKRAFAIDNQAPPICSSISPIRSSSARANLARNDASKEGSFLRRDITRPLCVAPPLSPLYKNEIGIQDDAAASSFTMPLEEGARYSRSEKRRPCMDIRFRPPATLPRKIKPPSPKCNRLAPKNYKSVELLGPKRYVKLRKPIPEPRKKKKSPSLSDSHDSLFKDLSCPLASMEDLMEAEKKSVCGLQAMSASPKDKLRSAASHGNVHMDTELSVQETNSVDNESDRKSKNLYFSMVSPKPFKATAAIPPKPISMRPENRVDPFDSDPEASPRSRRVGYCIPHSGSFRQLAEPRYSRPASYMSMTGIRSILADQQDETNSRLPEETGITLNEDGVPDPLRLYTNVNPNNFQALRSSSPCSPMEGFPSPATSNASFGFSLYETPVCTHGHRSCSLHRMAERPEKSLPPVSPTDDIYDYATLPLMPLTAQQSQKSRAKVTSVMTITFRKSEPIGEDAFALPPNEPEPIEFSGHSSLGKSNATFQTPEFSLKGKEHATLSSNDTESKAQDARTETNISTFYTPEFSIEKKESLIRPCRNSDPTGLQSAQKTRRETKSLTFVEPAFTTRAPLCWEPIVSVPAKLSDNPIVEAARAITPAPKPKDKIAHPAKKRKERIPLKEISEIPDDLTALSVGEVSRVLKLLNMVEYAERLQREQVDGSLMMALTQATLVEDFQFTKFKANKLMKFIGGWRPNGHL